MGFVFLGFSLLFFKVFFHVMHLMLENSLLLWNPICNQLRNLNFTNNLPGFKLINSQLITVKIVSPKAPLHFSLTFLPVFSSTVFPPCTWIRSLVIPFQLSADH